MPASLRRAVVRAVRLGEWQRLTTQTFLAGVVPAGDEQRLWAGLLQGGREAMLSGRSALVTHGWTHGHDGSVHVLVPANVYREPLPDWLLIHRVARPPCNPMGQPRRVTAHVAVAHAAAWARTDREAVFVVISALQQGLTEAGRLITVAAENRSLHRRGLIIQCAREYSGGIQSLNELDFARICRRYGLPAPVRQTPRYDKAGKCRWIDVEFTTRAGRTVMVEVEGLHHLNPQTWMEDTHRFNGLVVTGTGVILRVNTFMLTYEAERFLTDLASALGVPLRLPSRKSGN